MGLAYRRDRTLTQAARTFITTVRPFGGHLEVARRLQKRSALLFTRVRVGRWISAKSTVAGRTIYIGEPSPPLSGEKRQMRGLERVSKRIWRRIETANGAVRGLSQEQHSVPYIRMPDGRQNWALSTGVG